jgi:GAF domain-containing protein
MLGLTKVWLYLREEEQPYLSLRAHAGLSPRYLQRRARLGVDEDLVAELLAGGDQVLEADTHSGDMGDLVVEAEGLRAQCAAPLRAGERVIGLLGGARGEVYPWNARDARLLRAIAAQASLALHNALLYEQVRDAAQAQAASNELLQGLNMDLLDSQAAQEYQLEELGRQAAALQVITARTAQLREQANGLMQVVRVLCSPAAGTLTLAQQLQVQALVRGLAALSSDLETPGDPSAIA